MRLRWSGVSALLGTAVAVLAASALAVPRTADAGPRHGAVRITRGALQRLDLGEAPGHGADDPEATLTVATDGVGDFESAASTGHPAPPGRLTAAPVIGGDFTPGAVLVPRSDRPPSSRSHRPSRGRAPPRN